MFWQDHAPRLAHIKLKFFLKSNFYFRANVLNWVDEILKGSLDSIPSPSPLVKTQIIGRNTFARAVKAKHCWSTNFWKQNVCWPSTQQVNFPANDLNFHALKVKVIKSRLTFEIFSPSLHCNEPFDTPKLERLKLIKNISRDLRNTSSNKSEKPFSLQGYKTLATAGKSYFQHTWDSSFPINFKK